MSLVRTLILPLAAVSLLAVPAAAPGATGGPTQTASVAVKRPGLVAKLESCKTANGARSAGFKASMPALPTVRGRMEIRFELFQRTGALAPWTQVTDVDSFDEWDLSDPGVSGFIVKKRVFALAAGSSYRARVSYRWRDAGGRVRRTLRKLTLACVQPDTLPELVLSDPSITLAGRSDAVAYRVAVRNTGTATASPFAVTLTVNDTTQPQQVVGPLAPGQRIEVTFQAPRCRPGTRVRFVADAAAAVAEGDEANNVLERTCRASAG